MPTDNKPKQMKIAIFGKYIEAKQAESVRFFFNKLQDYPVEIWIFGHFLKFLQSSITHRFSFNHTFRSASELPEDTDFLISLGGDGTFLDSVSLVRGTRIPIMGINFGKLGFLANISIPEMNDALELLFSGKYTVEQRSMVQVDIPDNPFAPFPVGLNEFTIQKSGAGLLQIHTFIDNEYLCTYWADGLIASTPTGSTAYSLSVGGPIVNPKLSTFILSAIAPHHLTVRPLIIPDSCTLRFEANGRDEQVLLTLDSRNAVYPTPINITLKKAPFPANIVCLKGSTFYGTLRSKLLLGIDNRN